MKSHLAALFENNLIIKKPFQVPYDCIEQKPRVICITTVYFKTPKNTGFKPLLSMSVDSVKMAISCSPDRLCGVKIIMMGPH